MEIVNIQKPRIFFGYHRIIIRKFNRENYKSLFKLLKNSGMKRNQKDEKKWYNFALEGYRKLMKKETNNRKEFNKRLREYKSELKKEGNTSPVFESTNHYFHFTFSPKGKVLAGSFRSRELSIDEFYSLMLSNS